MDFFIKDFAITDTQEELEKLQEEFHNFSKEYIASVSIKERRDWIDTLWKICESHVEKNFRQELATKGKFTQKAWELVIGFFLKKK